MKVTISWDDGSVFSSYTEEDVKKELMEEVVHTGAQPTITAKDIIEELISWITTDMKTLYRNQKEKK
jgi:hypothetical protein